MYLPKSACMILATLLLPVPGIAPAHHSFAQYDQANPVELDGVITL